ncbi:MAG: hypothetical protein KGJ41_05270 [Rhodospirillales bacterium]|nr:hypothetical protein [Rhodospirillales bacterium]MDE2198416.1 hypothetical protein [Rhodospirillales bacterium]
MRWWMRCGGLGLVAATGLGVAAALALAAGAIAVIGGGLLPVAWRTPRTDIYGFALVCVVLALWLLMVPILSYLRQGQARKIATIRGFYSAELILRYFDQFWRGRAEAMALVAAWRAADGAIDDALRARADDSFAAFFEEEFGGAKFAAPAMLLAAIGFIVLFFGFAGGLALAERLAGAGVPVRPLGVQMDLVSLAAIFGAYTWIGSDVILRAHRLTLHPTDLLWYALRLVVAVPLGQAVAQIAGSGAGQSGAFLAFVVSMFSFDSIARTLTGVAARANALPEAGPEERADVVLKLPGVDQEGARTLTMEGVGTIAQLIAADPVRLSIQTGLAFEYVLGLVDAALLWRCVGAQLDLLRPFGFIGASQVRDFVGAPPAGVDAAQLYSAVATRIGVSEQGVRNAFTMLAADPYVAFVGDLLTA